jgi:hypothetical protein
MQLILDNQKSGMFSLECMSRVVPRRSRPAARTGLTKKDYWFPVVNIPTKIATHGMLMSWMDVPRSPPHTALLRRRRRICERQGQALLPALKASYSLRFLQSYRASFNQSQHYSSPNVVTGPALPHPMTDFQFPLLIASIDSSLQLSFPQQAQSFFSSSDIKSSSPAIVISCFNSTSTLFPNLFNTLLSSCSIALPTTPGIWLRHLFQQPVVVKSSSVSSPPRDGNFGQVALILDVVTTGLSHVRPPCPFTHTVPLHATAHSLTPTSLRTHSFQCCRRSRRACSRWRIHWRRTFSWTATPASCPPTSASPPPSLNTLLSAPPLRSSLFIPIATDLLQQVSFPLQILEGDRAPVDRHANPCLFWCLSPEAVAHRSASCPDEISPNNPNFMENYLRISSDHTRAILSLFSHHYQVSCARMHAGAPPL